MHPHGAAGFSQLEVLLGLLAGSLLLGALLSCLLFLQRSAMPALIAEEGQVLSLAPAYAPFPAALRVQEALLDQIEGASAVYVFGGGHAGPGAAAATMPLELASLPVACDFSAGLPGDALGFYARYSAQLGPQRTNADKDEFSLLVIGPLKGRSSLLCLVQCRARAFELPGRTGVLRRFDVSYLDAGGLRLSYRFASPPSAAGTLACGATHTWYRFSEALGIREEGPVCVTFPDPWRFAGSPDDASLPGSRFTLLLTARP
jgi:hypothetical protein